ncbi:hypothetical protein [Stratiformator vulcanicus]|uniref:Uncharacterized protein n=1 Tax=Stratiformator vulcanicus TaxID=2527980 RepID=A0A517QVY0_9PLAN|nr:hypothetical protein [Stratiformator vulcanicus]QDT35815.1 hypothetical protein Pan189_01680 [Stratiformator vulcanicus]
MDPVRTYNLIETVWWCGLGLATLLLERRSSVSLVVRYSLAVTLFVFGLSDLVEISTGAWWKPWPLAVLKFACGSGISLLALAWWRQTRRGKAEI